MKWRRKGSLILAAGGVMAAAALVRGDVMVCLFRQGFKAYALIWTLCHQDVRIVGFLRKT
jgi:hypothetical protein